MSVIPKSESSRNISELHWLQRELKSGGYNYTEEKICLVHRVVEIKVSFIEYVDYRVDLTDWKDLE